MPRGAENGGIGNRRYGSLIMCRLALAACCFLLLAGPARASDFDWGLPDWMPPPPVPVANPMSAAKVELGRRLFFDSRLSAPNYLTCAHCHKPELGFADSRPFSFGMSGEMHPRNTPGLANVGYLSPLGWVDPDVLDLESQVLVPLFNTRPVEMMAKGMEDDIVRRLEADRVTREHFEAAFPETGGRIDMLAIQRALAAFQRSLVSFGSPFDRWYGGEPEAIDAEARRGWDLFNDPEIACARCHTPPLFTDALLPGVPRDAPAGDVSRPAFGHSRTHDAAGRPLRTPSLRNVEATPPYMHDARHATLGDVLAAYRLGSGAALDAAERAALLALLESLTDRQFLENETQASPYRLTAAGD